MTEHSVARRCVLRLETEHRCGLARADEEGE
jgi:hypothetical protein